MNLKNQLVIGTGALFGLIAFNMTSANADEVTVKHGDTLSQIAQDHQTTVDAIKTANNLSSDLIVTGDVLTINDDSNSNMTQQTQDTYTVQAGDTLSEIAETYNIDINTLAQINNISDQNLIIVGDVLQLKQTQNTSPQDAQTASVSDNSNSADIHTQATQQSSTSRNAGSSVSANINNTQANTSSYASTNVSGSEADAKAWIAMRESGSNYNARNGQYIGKYQLTDIYLNGDYSPANQERTADQYVYGRYGSWVNAKNFWLSHGWY